MLGLRQAGTTKKCGKCSRDVYKTNPRTGKLYAYCETCRLKNNAQVAEYRNTDAGKAAMEQYKQSDAGKAVQKRAIEQYNQSEKGKAKIQRLIAKRQIRRQGSPAMRLALNIKTLANDLLSGRTKKSPTFLRHTPFDSEAQFLAHVEAECKKHGLDFETRSTWEIDRKIPQEAYDFDNPDDVFRCWSPANITALTLRENQEKSWKLIDSWIHSVGPACFPLAWQNRMPTDEMKKAHDDRMKATKSVGEQVETPASNESEEDESEEDESEEDEFEDESDA